MGKSKVISAEEAVGLIKDGDCITVSGTVTSLLPAKLLQALEVRFLTEGHPRDITWFDPFPTGVPGIEPLSHEGFLKRVIGGWYTPHPALREMILSNKVEAYMYPLGSLSFWCQQLAAGRKGYLTQTGLETYLDPRQTGGRLNEVTKEEMVSLVQLKGEDYIFYKAFPITFAILRGSSADEDGNLSLEDETSTMNILYQAMAAKRYGGTVIAQVKRVVPAGSIHPRMVTVPNFLVDHIVVDEEQRPSEGPLPERDWLRQNDRVARPPSSVLVSRDAEVWRTWLVDGALHPSTLDDPYPLAPDKIIGRRAAFELKPGDVVNVGAGLPMRELNPVAIEEEVEQQVELTSEAGAVGGIFNGAGFRSNVTYYFDTPGIFSYYQAGLIPTSYLSMLEFDRQGNVNLLRYGDIIVGPGGSMDIANSAKKVVFCGTFSAGGLKTQAGEGKLSIVQEGKTPRVVDKVQWVCFNGPKMHREGKEVLYVTERAVFRLTGQGPVLCEVAPGVDIERDVIGRMGFRPVIAPDLKTMDGRIFRKEPMGLKRAWAAPSG